MFLSIPRLQQEPENRTQNNLRFYFNGDDFSFLL
jgi:hypothetical protein